MTVEDDSSTIQIVAYTCLHGYSLEGESQRYCLEDGTWTGQTPNCTKNVIVEKTPHPFWHSDVFIILLLVLIVAEVIAIVLLVKDFKRQWLVPTHLARAANYRLSVRANRTSQSHYQKRREETRRKRLGKLSEDEDEDEDDDRLESHPLGEVKLNKEETAADELYLSVGDNDRHVSVNVATSEKKSQSQFENKRYVNQPVADALDAVDEEHYGEDPFMDISTVRYKDKVQPGLPDSGELSITPPAYQNVPHS